MRDIQAIDMLRSGYIYLKKFKVVLEKNNVLLND